MPRLGLTRTSLLFGVLNALVGLWATWLLRGLIEGGVRGQRVRGCVVLAILGIGLWKADYVTSLAESDLFTDPVVYARTTPYQRIVITAGQSGFQLFLNGHLQFHSADEYRYHEALVHPALALAGHPRRVLVLGGGDGLAFREVLKIPSVEAVTLVDLDAEMTGLSDRFQPLAELNSRAFHDPRVQVINHDAMLWLAEPGPAYDAAIVDFPDPHSFAIGKLYTTRFYRMLQQRLTPNAAVAVQCTSPLFARKSYWCIIRTLEAAGFAVRPYQAAVPSFGVWGFALAADEVRASARRARRAEVPHLTISAGVVRAACRPWAAAGGDQSVGQPGAGAVSRHGLEKVGLIDRRRPTALGAYLGVFDGDFFFAFCSSRDMPVFWAFSPVFGPFPKAGRRQDESRIKAG